MAGPRASVGLQGREEGLPSAVEPKADAEGGLQPVEDKEGVCSINRGTRYAVSRARREVRACELRVGVEWLCVCESRDTRDGCGYSPAGVRVSRTCVV